MGLSRISLTSAGGTNVGLVRTSNQDSFLASFPVFLVADGMGGHAVGDVASQTALTVFEPLLGRTDITIEEVVRLTEAAQLEVSALSSIYSEGVGTTLTGIIAIENEGELNKWLVLNIGDSRTYRLAGGTLEQLTQDHSMVNQAQGEQAVAQGLAEEYYSRHIITRALGDGVGVPDLWTVDFAPGETFLVASDGLTSELPRNQLERILTQSPSPKDSVLQLINAALTAGGRDNVTAVVVSTGGLVQQPGNQTHGQTNAPGQTGGWENARGLSVPPPRLSG